MALDLAKNKQDLLQKYHHAQNDEGTENTMSNAKSRTSSPRKRPGSSNRPKRRSSSGRSRPATSRHRPMARSCMPTTRPASPAGHQDRGRRDGSRAAKDLQRDRPERPVRVNTKMRESQVDRLSREHEGENPRRRFPERDARRHCRSRSLPCPTRRTPAARASRSTRPRSRSISLCPVSARA